MSKRSQDFMACVNDKRKHVPLTVIQNMEIIKNWTVVQLLGILPIHIVLRYKLFMIYDKTQTVKIL